MAKFLCFLLMIGFSVGNPFGNNVDMNFQGNWICTGLRQGAQLPHPEDCTSYFVCNNGFPTLINCEPELHYDRLHNVCNWPAAANCILGLYPNHWNASKPIYLTTTTTLTTPKIETPPTTKTKQPTFITTPTTHRPPTRTTTTSQTLWTYPPETHITPPIYCIMPINPNEIKDSSTGAINNNGQIINSLDNYNPMNVQCYHNGLYFLPHPANCEKYFICSNHILYLHRCGDGIFWNYETERCELIETSKCYYYDHISISSTTKRRKTPTPSTPIPTTLRTTATTKMIRTTPIISTTKQPQQPDKLPECPSRVQKFLPHPTDCTKYYICIAGMPALTTCPNGMYWDEREEWCGYPEFTYCRAAVNGVQEDVQPARKKKDNKN